MMIRWCVIIFLVFALSAVIHYDIKFTKKTSSPLAGVMVISLIFRLASPLLIVFYFKFLDHLPFFWTPKISQQKCVTNAISSSSSLIIKWHETYLYSKTCFEIFRIDTIIYIINTAHYFSVFQQPIIVDRLCIWLHTLHNVSNILKYFSYI